MATVGTAQGHADTAATASGLHTRKTHSTVSDSSDDAEKQLSSTPDTPEGEVVATPVQLKASESGSPTVNRNGLEWFDITYDIPLSRKARKAAEEAAKEDAASQVEKADLDSPGAAQQPSPQEPQLKPGHRRILDHISGHVKRGEMVAVLGASGAGKTTLLNILSARIGSKGDLHGKVLINGQKRNPATWKRSLGYVEQDDLLNAELTVEETLSFAAKLRLPSATYSSKDKRQRVEETIDMLRLEKCRDTRIGAEGKRGVSGGERKRTSIAAELLSDVSALYLDEPSSGLDAYAAVSVIENLKEVTRKRNLITLMTIHQPSWRIFNLFDRVILLTRGGVFYDAPPALTVPYFASFGHNVPEGVNPADHYIQIAEAFEKTPESEKRVLGLLNHWKSEEGQSTIQDLVAKKTASVLASQRASIDGAKAGDAASEEEQESQRQLRDALSDERERAFQHWPSNWFYEAAVLAYRNYLIAIRNPALIYGTIAQTVILCIIIGFSFFRLPYDQGGVLGRIGLLFFVLINSSFSVLFPIIAVFPLAHAIMRRERSAGMYRTSSFFVSKLLVEIPTQITQRVWFYVVLYWMVGLKANAGSFFIWLLTNMISILVSIGQGYMIGSLTPDVQIANLIAPLLNVIFLLFAGNLLPTNSIPPWLRWIRFISFIGYAYSALAQNEFAGLTFACTGGGGPTSSSQCYKTGEDVLSAYDLTIFTIWENLGFLCAILSVFLTLTYLFLRFLGHPRFRYV